jgi:hypothetical protein
VHFHGSRNWPSSVVSDGFCRTNALFDAHARSGVVPSAVRCILEQEVCRGRESGRTRPLLAARQDGPLYGFTSRLEGGFGRFPEPARPAKTAEAYKTAEAFRLEFGCGRVQLCCSAGRPAEGTEIAAKRHKRRKKRKKKSSVFDVRKHVLLDVELRCSEVDQQAMLNA